MVTGQRAVMHSYAHSTILATGLQLAWHLGFMQTIGSCFLLLFLLGCLHALQLPNQQFDVLTASTINFFWRYYIKSLGTPSPRLMASSVLQDFHQEFHANPDRPPAPPGDTLRSPRSTSAFAQVSRLGRVGPQDGPPRSITMTEWT